MKTFEEAWAEMEAKGYHYGEDALALVAEGWYLRDEAGDTELDSQLKRLQRLYEISCCPGCSHDGCGHSEHWAEYSRLAREHEAAGKKLPVPLGGGRFTMPSARHRERVSDRDTKDLLGPTGTAGHSIKKEELMKSLQEVAAELKAAGHLDAAKDLEAMESVWLKNLSDLGHVTFNEGVRDGMERATKIAVTCRSAAVNDAPEWVGCRDAIVDLIRDAINKI